MSSDESPALAAPIGKKPRSNKMAQLMGIDESTATAAQAQAKKDRNFEARTQLLKLGYELPPGPIATDMSVGALYQKHRTMPNVWAPQFDDGKSDPSRRFDLYRAPPLMHMLVTVKHTMFNVGEPAELYFSLYSCAQRRFVSEEFMLRLTMTGVCDELKAPQKCLFTDVRVPDLVNGGGLWLCCRIFRLGILDSSKKPKLGSNDQAYRRPFGVAMLQITQKLVTLPEGKESLPPNASLYVPGAEKDFATLHEVIIEKPQSLQPVKNSGGIAYGLTMFDGDVEEVRKNFPKDVAANVVAVPRTSALDLRTLVSARHFLYLTLDSAEFSHGTKTAQKNMLCKIQLRDNKGKPVSECIARGMGQQVVKETDFLSTVYYHNNSPNFAERICVWLPPTHLDRYHLFFDFQHVSSDAQKGHDAVALSWVPLVDEKSAAFLPNQTQKLVIWSLSKKEGVNEQYMTWDAATKEKRNTKQVFVVHSQLSSTLASCDVDLQRVLHFTAYGWETVDSALKNLLRKPVGLLLECSARLLEQLLEIALADNYSDAKPAAVQAVFHVMASLGQSGKDVAAVLRDYLTTQCASTSAYGVLLPALRTLFGWCSTARDADFADSNPQFQELTLAIRALGSSLQLIVKSYTLDEKTGSPAQRKDDFRRSLLRLLDDIVKFIGKSSAKLCNLQRNVIVNFSRDWIDCLEPVCTVAEQAKFLIDFLDRIPLDDKFFTPPIPKGLGLSINTGFGAFGSGDEPSGPLSPTGRATSNSMMKDSPMGTGAGAPPINRKGSMLTGAMLDSALSANGLGGAPPPLQRMASPGPERNLRGSVATRGAGDLKSPMAGGGMDSKGMMSKLSEDGFGLGEPALGAGAGAGAGTAVTQNVPDDSTSLLKLQLIRGLIAAGLGVSGDPATAKRWRRHFFVALFKQLKLHIDAEREINENLAVIGLCNDMLAVLAQEYGAASSDAAAVAADAKHRDVKGAPGDDEDLPPPPPPPGDDDDADAKKAVATPKKAVPVLAVDAPENESARCAIERDHLFGLVPGVTTLLQKFLKARQHKTLPQLEKRFLPNIKTDSKEYIQDTTAVFLGLLEVLARHVDPFLIEMNSKRAGADSAFVSQLYDVFGQLIKYSVFHKYWVVLRMVELQGTVKLLEWSGAYLVRAFLQENRFDIPLWRQHFAVGMSAALCEDATLEDNAEARRKFINEKYGDIRLQLIEHYKATWEWVAQKHVHMAEALLGPAVDLTQSRLESLRAMGRDWYMDLIRAEIEGSGSLKGVLYHTIDVVGRVVHDFGSQKLARGKEQMDGYMAFFENDLAKALASATGAHADAMRLAGNQLIRDIGEMFQHLYSLESLPQQPQYEDERTLACINLMSYLKGNGRQELYVKYVNYLCELHEKHQNYTEWGNTLHLHQSLLGYGTNELEETGNLPAAVEADRKVALLQAAMSAYDKGEFWERAIEVGRDLAGAYETKLFYIAGVSSLLRQQANYWEKIVAQDRIFRAFYRVKFIGAGFGPDVRGKEFVCRSGNGGVLESVKDFTDRVKKKYPDAFVSNTPELPPGWVFGDAKKAGEYDEFDTSKPPAQLAALGSDALKRLQYIQITTLSTSSPEELKNQPSKWDDIDAPTRLIRYHKQNNVNTFVYTRVSKKHKPEVKKGEKTNEFRDLWVLRTFVQTAEPLPSIRRRAEVVERTEVLMSPIENAVFNIVTKNNELKEIIADVAVSREERVNTGPLSMNLAGVIDAAVQGGVEKYKEAFFDGTYLLINPTHGHFINQFKAALGKQIDILRHGLDVFGSKCDNTLVPLLTHLTKTYGQMCESLKNIVS